MINWNFDRPLTCRGILTTISSIYDPFGLLGPLLLPERKILQRITDTKQGWDEPLLSGQRASLQKWRDDLRVLPYVKINRCFMCESFSGNKSVQLHHFSDASTYGYGVASYLRIRDTEHNICSNLLMGKSRVVPKGTP